MASFTDGKPRIATQEDLQANWGGGRSGEYFRCCLCGYRFKEGDYWRWQYTNDIPGAGGNPLVCKKCDGPDVIEKWKQMHKEAKGRMWWFTRYRDAR